MTSDQAWELAGLASADGDRVDAARWTKEALRLQKIEGVTKTEDDE